MPPDRRATVAPRICEVVMHDVLLPDLEAWLNARGLVLQRTPFLDTGPDLPSYNVAPHPDRIRAEKK